MRAEHTFSPNAHRVGPDAKGLFTTTTLFHYLSLLFQRIFTMVQELSCKCFVGCVYFSMLCVASCKVLDSENRVCGGLISLSGQMIQGFYKLIISFAFVWPSCTPDATISNVIESWEALRRTENFEQVAGSRLFQL